MEEAQIVDVMDGSGPTGWNLLVHRVVHPVACTHPAEVPEQCQLFFCRLLQLNVSDGEYTKICTVFQMLD